VFTIFHINTYIKITYVYINDLKAEFVENLLFFNNCNYEVIDTKIYFYQGKINAKLFKELEKNEFENILYGEI